ncbi:MAG: IucA/IucC family C-terminal-domain containing protein [Acidimicrobiales bacterium]
MARDTGARPPAPPADRVASDSGAVSPAGAPDDLRALLEQVTAAASWLRWRIVDAPPRARLLDRAVATPAVDLAEGELSCAALAGDPETLAAAVVTSGEGRGSDDLGVLASLWWQGYAYRVAGTALACWLLTGRAPDVRADGMAVGVSRSRPSSVAFLPGADAPTADLPVFCDRLFAGHLDLVAASLRARHTVGAQLVWGNVAAACASAAGAVRHAVRDGWSQGVEAFAAAAPHDLASLGEWSCSAPGDADGEWSYQRRTCCLWWKTAASGGALCSDCSLHRGGRPPHADVAG